MATLSMAAYSAWSRVVIAGQSVSAEADLAVVDARREHRFAPSRTGCIEPTG